MEIARVKVLTGAGRRRGVGLCDREALPEHIPRAEQRLLRCRAAGPGRSPGAAPGPGGRSRALSRGLLV